MEVTEVQVRLVSERERPNDRILAYVSVVFDGQLVVHDVRVVKGHRGLLVAMPDRMITDRCYSCHAKNGIRHEFCCQCGVRIDRTRALKDGWAQTHKDVLHPLDLTFRRETEAFILNAYHKEVGRLSSPFPSPDPELP